MMKQWKAGTAAVLVAMAVATTGYSLKAQEAAGQHDEKPLEKAMSGIGKAYKALGRQIKDASKNESSLALVAEMQKQTVVAKGIVPDTIAEAPAADRAKMVVIYRKLMGQTLKAEVDLEANLLDGDNAKAAETLAELKKLMGDGHKQFRKDD